MIIKSIISLALVLCLIGVVAFIFARVRSRLNLKFAPGGAVRHVIRLDARTKVMVIDYENVSYVILMGPQGSTLLDKKEYVTIT